ncbi:SA1362 family protein [Amphibacillus sp. Q70]|uniref:SA1362 family protein n=1 Tax=Amphibacillus sp. Q70 TaxID=3453416 RepID=UPI003F867979
MIKKRRLSPFLLITLTLAILGLANTLFANPSQWVKNILLFIISAIIVYSLVYFFIIRKRHNKDELEKYRQAVKQSKMRQKKRQQSQISKVKPKRVNPLSKRKTTNPPHLRVIDGKKASKKRPMSL